MSKVEPIIEALERAVRPGDHLHLALGQARPNLAIRALLKLLRGTSPKLRVSATGLGGAQLGLFLIVCGLVETVETSFLGDQFPRPGPNRGVNALIDDHSVDVRAWTLLTMLQRVEAGATGIPWTVTGSLDGSSMLVENPDVRRLEDLTLVRALRPDVTLLHGVLADEDGNTVLSVPVGDAIPSAIAARRGAIVTVERVVSRRELRELAGHPILPGCFVRSVSEMRHGAHPAGVYAPTGLERYEYGEDYEFIGEAAAALSMEPAAREAWIERRLLVGDLEDDYLAELGDERIARLDNWRTWVPAEARSDRPATPEERMAVVGARKIGALVDAAKPPYVLAGIGVSCLAVWLARSAREQFPALISELGLYDYDPVAGNPFLFYFPNLATATVLTDAQVILGGMLQARRGETLAVVSAGQVDRCGNLNTTRTARGWISGSGGANDIVSSSMTVALMLHRRGRLVERVDYITSPGERVAVLGTDKAVFEREPDSGQLVLTGVIAAQDDLDDAVEQVRAATPWPLRIARQLTCHELPEPSELAAVRRYDPAGSVLGREPA